MLVSDCEIRIRKDLSETTKKLLLYIFPTILAITIEAESCKGTEDASYCQSSANTSIIKK